MPGFPSMNHNAIHDSIHTITLHEIH